MRKYSIEDFKVIVENEGLEYTICDYLNPEDIEDKKLQKLCKDAREKLQQIRAMIDFED